MTKIYINPVTINLARAELRNMEQQPNETVSEFLLDSPIASNVPTLQMLQILIAYSNVYQKNSSLAFVVQFVSKS